MGRRLLTGIDLPNNWTSLGGALEGALRAAGERVTTPWVMGVTGLAFRAAVPAGIFLEPERPAFPGAAPASGASAGHLPAAPESGLGVRLAPEAALDPARAVAAIRRLGRKVSSVFAEREDRDYAKRRAEAIKRVHKSLDRGVPAIVFDLHLPSFGMVVGYDDGAGLWFVRSMLSGQTGDRLPVDRWPVPERGTPVLVFVLEGRAQFDRRQAVLGALRGAVDYAEHGEPGDRTGAFHGTAAIVRWRQAFAEGEAVDAHTNALMVHMLQSARRDAAAFLRTDAPAVLPGAAGVLERVAAAYTAEVLALSRMMTMFPFPSGGDPRNPAARAVAVGALTEVLRCEHDAVTALHEVTRDH